MSGRIAWLARRDGSVVLGRGTFTQAAEPPADGIAFYKRDFATQEEMPWWIPSSSNILPIKDFQATHAMCDRAVIRWEEPDAMPFSMVFQEIMSCIQRGEIEKTVPVVTETGRASGGQGGEVMAAMAAQDAPLYSYGWGCESSGFAGATPELLFALDGRSLGSMALAGTARCEDEAVFSVDEKEIREHEYVAQTLISKLVGLGTLHRNERRVLRLGSIIHFHTGIKVSLKSQVDTEQLVRLLHPTPALGPLPRTGQTMESLRAWREKLGCPREFGAPFGVWDCGKFEAVVAIRGMWWDGNQISLPAGCGIIEASRLVNEWRELRWKREAVKAFLF